MSDATSRFDNHLPAYRNAIIRRFDFTSALMRMSVICKNNIDSAQYRAFVKGSPEKMEELCTRESMPADFHSVLEHYTREGYRVVALASKVLTNMTYRKAQSVDRAEIESNLHFLGLFVMVNKLKPQTTGVIQNLQECNVRTVMATGDNLLTAMSVATHCSILQADKDIWLADVHMDHRGQEVVFWRQHTSSANRNKIDEKNLPI